jgi:homogentisate 1,2-dioxygenase
MADFKWVNQPTKWQVENSIPPGVSHRTFMSESMDLDVGYFIYRPEFREKQLDRAFPVVFHLHGDLIPQVGHFKKSSTTQTTPSSFRPPRKPY